MCTIYLPFCQVISKKFLDDPKAFGDAFAKAWYKLTHRDLGPQIRLLGPYVPPPQPWQDPLPPAPTSGNGAVGALSASQLAALKSACLAAPELSVASLVKGAWASASSYRATDRRGGANGARLLLAPQKVWWGTSSIKKISHSSTRCFASYKIEFFFLFLF